MLICLNTCLLYKPENLPALGSLRPSISTEPDIQHLCSCLSILHPIFLPRSLSDPESLHSPSSTKATAKISCSMASEPPLERPPSQSNQAQTSTLTIAPTTAQLIQHWSTTWNHIKTFLRQNKLVDADEACAYLLRDEKLGTIWKGCCHLVLATVIVMTRSRFRSLNAVAL